MSQGQFAEKIGVARQTVSSWENDVFTPDTQKVIQMAKLFDCTTDELLNPAQAE
jgi:DNA-binding XRE family transcriptional regulator